MDWIVASVFKMGDGWIPSMVKSPRHRFHMLNPDYVHDRSRPNASLQDWKDYLRHALRAWRATQSHAGPSGIITTFPQLALIVGTIKRLTWSRKPVVAWMFNLGQTYGGLKGHLARFGLASVDKFVVHSTNEIEVYSQWLGLPRERFEFVPLSIAQKQIDLPEDADAPFLLSMGTANRDYPLLLRVLARLPYPAVIVAGAHALQGLEVPPNVRVLSNLSIDECHNLCQRARISIIPLQDTGTAAGQVSVLEAMMFGRPVIATRCVGTEDYIRHGVDGMLVTAASDEAMQKAIEHLWENHEQRLQLAAAARKTSLENYTFRGVASRMEHIVEQLGGPVKSRFSGE